MNNKQTLFAVPYERWKLLDEEYQSLVQDGIKVLDDIFLSTPEIEAVFDILPKFAYCAKDRLIQACNLRSSKNYGSDVHKCLSVNIEIYKDDGIISDYYDSITVVFAYYPYVQHKYDYPIYLLKQDSRAREEFVNIMKWIVNEINN